MKTFKDILAEAKSLGTLDIFRSTIVYKRSGPADADHNYTILRDLFTKSVKRNMNLNAKLVNPNKRQVTNRGMVVTEISSTVEPMIIPDPRNKEIWELWWRVVTDLKKAGFRIK